MIFKNKFVILILFILSTISLTAQNIQIVNTTPTINQHSIAVDANIVIQFDQTINGTTLNDNTFIVRGSNSGIISGIFSGGGTTTITFNPTNNFRAGETISYTITTSLQSNGGNTLSRGYTYSFAVGSSSAGFPQISFAQRDFAKGLPGSRDVKALDFDADGDLDIIASNEGLPEQIIWYENDGNQYFCGINTGGNFRNVEVYDIEGDGDYDNFGATGSFDTEINWFENEGTFPFTERLISSEDPWTLAGGDIDSDGDIDLLAAVILPNRLFWFRNDGSGSFTQQPQIATTFSGGSDSYFYIQDINSDGSMDILAFHRDARDLVWYENNGSQVFTEHLISNSTDRSRLASGDIDGDGDIDIVRVSNENAPTSPISWYENNGSQVFTEHVIASTSTRRIYSVEITDIEGDQDMDILAGGYGFENDGSENFTENFISDGLKVGDYSFANGISSADIDNDGDIDILTFGTHSLSWHEHHFFMNVTSSSPANANSNVDLNSNITISFDVTIDNSSLSSETIKVRSVKQGYLAGVFSGGGTNTITFDPNNNFLAGDNIEVSITKELLGLSGHSLAITHGFSFTTKTTSGVSPSFQAHSIKIHTSNVSGLAIADIDGDGDLDLTTSTWAELNWHQNDGAGNFTSHEIPVSDVPVSVFAFDQNDDGHTDLWIDNNSFTSSMVFINDGNENFTETNIAGNLRLKQVSDLNNDGDLDLLYNTRIDRWTNWLDNHCDKYSGYGLIPRINTNDLISADLDNDGNSDLVAAGSQGSIYYSNNGFMIFTPDTIDISNTISVTLADLDNDNDLDPIYVTSFSGIVWYENRLNESSNDFSNSQDIAALSQDPRDVIALDIDSDGDYDIAAVSRNDDKVVWYENRLNEATNDFGAEHIIPAGADGPIMIKSGDLDGDGDIDLVTISDGDDELIWYENTGSPVDIDVDDDNNQLPKEYALEQNFPNPFNPTTTIEYLIPKAGFVKISVYNLLGQKIIDLVNSEKQPGSHSVKLNAESVSGRISSGVYIYRLESNNKILQKKMLLLK